MPYLPPIDCYSVNRLVSSVCYIVMMIPIIIFNIVLLVNMSSQFYDYEFHGVSISIITCFYGLFLFYAIFNIIMFFSSKRHGFFKCFYFFEIIMSVSSIPVFCWIAYVIFSRVTYIRAVMDTKIIILLSINFGYGLIAIIIIPLFALLLEFHFRRLAKPLSYGA